MSKFSSYPGDNPDNDQELRKGDTVLIQHGESAPDTENPLTVLAVGSSRDDYHYIIQSMAGQKYKVTVEEVIEVGGLVPILLNPVITPYNDETEISMPEIAETEYELIGTEASRAGQYVIIKSVKRDGEEYNRKTPIVLWGHYIVKMYAGDKLMPLAERTTIFPMITLPGKLEPQRVTPDIFVDYYHTA